MTKTKLGAPLPSSDLYDIDPKILTPQYELYEDDFETHKHVPDADNDVDPETGDHLVVAKVCLPHGGTQ